MVNFSTFNELSLPLQNLNEFEDFFKVLENLKRHGLNKIRTDKLFTHYPEILENKTFQEVVGQIRDRDKKRRLLSFVNSTLITIESPLIKEEENEEHNQTLENEYFYKGVSTIGGLACCDIWNTLSVSFNSNKDWCSENIILQKQFILDKEEINIDIRHSSKVEHLEYHKDFFDNLEEEKRLDIKQENLWARREEFFPNKIVFCKEVEKQIENIDKVIFEQAIGILRDVESARKLITHYNHSGESKSVKEDDSLKRLRYFTIEDEKVFFENHIKSLPNANRIYFLEHKNKIYIGYIGKHLATKRH